MSSSNSKGVKYSNEQNGNINKAWVPSSSFEALPSLDYLSNTTDINDSSSTIISSYKNNHINNDKNTYNEGNSNTNFNHANSCSINDHQNHDDDHHQNSNNNKSQTTFLDLNPARLTPYNHHQYQHNIPNVTYTNNSTKSARNATRKTQLSHKILKNQKKRIFLKIVIFALISIVVAGFAITTFAALKPCLFTQCHKKASMCIDRFPFWAQCICDVGYVGNGKSMCSECGRTYVRTNLLRIVGGLPAVPSSWPFSAFIVQSYKGRYSLKGYNYIIGYSWSCGGTIINQKTILTAAHCIHTENFEYEDEDNDITVLSIKWNEWYPNLESTVEVYVGISDLNNLNLTKSYRVKKVNRHEDYDEYDFKNDIATLQLYDAIDATYNTQYACLPKSYSNAYPEENKDGFIIGWGRTSETGQSSDILKNSMIKIFDKSRCAGVEENITKYWDSQVCAGVLDGSTDSCQGDSGGGLYVKEMLFNESNSTGYVVSGVVSYGEGCARKGKPGIYSRTSYHIDWIRKNSDF